MTRQNHDSGALFVRLLELRDQAGERLYERLVLAQKLLGDREWVQSPEGGGGDESRAIDRLEDHCFADLCGSLSLPEMLDVLHHVPEFKTWKASRFNLRKLLAEVRARQKASTPARAEKIATPRATPEQQVRELREEIAEKERQYREKREEHSATSHQKISQLEQIVRELKHENKALRATCQHLEAALHALQEALQVA